MGTVEDVIAAGDALARAIAAEDEDRPSWARDGTHDRCWCATIWDALFDTDPRDSYDIGENVVDLID